MPDETHDFVTVLAALEAAHVRFVLIGGLAMVAHGSSHITQDIDICYSRDTANLHALTAAFRTYHPTLRGAPPDLPFLLDTRTFLSTLNLTLDTDIGPVDLLGDAPGVPSFEALWERSVTIEVGGLPVHVASLDDLIVMKEAANRPKDLNHLLELCALRKMIDGNPT